MPPSPKIRFWEYSYNCTVYTVGSRDEKFSIFSANFIQARYPKYEIKSLESFDNYAPLQSPPQRADRGNEAWSRPHGPKAVDSTTLLSFIFRGSEVLTLPGFVCGFDSFLNENKNRQNTSKHCQILPKYNNSLSRQNVAIADYSLSFRG